MEAAGMVPTAAAKKKKPLYGNKKKQQPKKKTDEEEEQKEAPKVAKEPSKEQVKEPEPVKPAEEEESSGDDWDNDDFEVNVPIIKEEVDEPGGYALVSFAFFLTLCSYFLNERCACFGCWFSFLFCCRGPAGGRGSEGKGTPAENWAGERKEKKSR